MKPLNSYVKKEHVLFHSWINNLDSETSSHLRVWYLKYKFIQNRIRHWLKTYSRKLVENGFMCNYFTKCVGRKTVKVVWSYGLDMSNEKIFKVKVKRLKHVAILHTRLRKDYLKTLYCVFPNPEPIL